jgi:hypothetical protein
MRIKSRPIGCGAPDRLLLKAFADNFSFLINHPDMEGIMRTRLVTLTLGLFLTFMVLGCNSKPADSTASSSPDSSAPPASNSGAADSSSSGGASSGSAMSNMSNMKSEAKPAAPKRLLVPAGTVLTVRLGQAVGSKISSAGETFTATVASPVTVDGRTAIPSGATASGTVVDAKPLGRFKGGASLQLRLTSITVNGADQAISTSSVVRSATGKGKRTAVLAGGGAGLGALIGGLAGGGKGAAIGALAGAGAGTGGAAFTGNKDIVLPAESALSFKLEQPLEVK